MNKEMNQILFNNLQKISIDKGNLPIGENAKYALSINRNLETFGYSLSSEAIECLSTQELPTMENTYNDILNVIKDYTKIDDFKACDLFYPNFPEEVMNKSEMELYFTSLLYYTFSQTDDEIDKEIALMIRDNFVEKKKKRLPLIKDFKQDLKVINLGTEAELTKMMDDRIHSLGMSETMMKELFEYQKAYPNKFSELITSDKPFQSKETLVKIASELRKRGLNNNLEHMMKDSMDVVRYAAMLSNERLMKNKNIRIKPNDVTLKRNKVIFNLSTEDKRLIKNMLNNCKNLYFDIWKNPGLYKRLMNRLDTKRQVPERVKEAFDNLASNNKKDETGKDIKTIYRMFDEAVNNITSIEGQKSLTYLAKNFPGAYFSRYINYLEKITENAKEDYNKKYENIVQNLKDFKVNDELLENVKQTLQADIDKRTTESLKLFAILVKYCDKVPVYEKIKVLNILEKRDSFGDYRINHNAANKSWKRIDNKKINISDDIKNFAKGAIQASIDEQTKDTMKLGKVYIDPELKNRIAPARQLRDSSGGAIVVQGSKIPMDKDKNISVFGVHWFNTDKTDGTGELRADIDIHAIAFDENFKKVGQEIYYSNLVEPWGALSGDYTNAPKELGGATEAIMIDKEKCRELGIKYIVPQVVGFNIPFDKVKDVCFCRLEKDGYLNRPKEHTRKTNKDSEKDNEENFKNEMLTIKNISNEKDKRYGKVYINGEVFEPSEQKNAIKLNAPATAEFTSIIDLEENVEYWLDTSEYLPLYHSDIDDKTENKLENVYTAMKQNVQPNMHQLFMNYAKTNGELVDDISKADTVFSVLPLDAQKEGLKKDAVVITSYDLDNISNNFSGNPIKLTEKELTEQRDINKEEKEQKQEQEQTEDKIQSQKQEQLQEQEQQEQQEQESYVDIDSTFTETQKPGKDSVENIINKTLDLVRAVNELKEIRNRNENTTHDNGKINIDEFER